ARASPSLSPRHSRRRPGPGHGRGVRGTGRGPDPHLRRGGRPRLRNRAIPPEPPRHLGFPRHGPMPRRHVVPRGACRLPRHLLRLRGRPGAAMLALLPRGRGAAGRVPERRRVDRALRTDRGGCGPRLRRGRRL
ncbi:MAG: hypothetical protein AVDCRST_MAG15-1803, partial [uncultured Rubellimicrobium sp.]